MSVVSKRALAVFTLLLLLIVTSRMIRLNTMQMDVDEVWTIWQTFGTPQQIVTWTPYNWMPLSFLALGAWKSFTGIAPLVLRYFSVLAFLPGCVFVYRLIWRLSRRRTTAALTMLAYAALGYSIYLSLIVRGYIFVMTLTPLGLWLVTRYFARPTLRRAIPLALCMAAMFYTYAPSVLAFAAMGLYSLIMYRRAVWRWWLPGVLAIVLVLPVISWKGLLTTTVNRTIFLPSVTEPLLQAMVTIFSYYTGHYLAVWAILFVAGTGFVFWRQRPLRAPGVAWLAWLVLMPLGLYLANPILGLFDGHYSWWVMIGLALWVGWALSSLPRAGVVVSGLALMAVMFSPIPVDSYRIPGPQTEINFKWLSEHLRAGDVLVVDPNCHAITNKEWDYYAQAFFPNGIKVVTKPDGYRRVWYVTREGSRDPLTDQAVSQNRLPREFVGTWDFLFRLYEGSPNPEGILFANGMRFHGIDMVGASVQDGPLIYRANEPIHIRLWWSVDRAVPLDYSVGVYVLQKNEQVAQYDSAPQVTDGPTATSRWEPGRLYVEDRIIVPPVMRWGDQPYRIDLVVYFYADQKRIEAPGVDSDMRLPIREFTIEAW